MKTDANPDVHLSPELRHAAEEFLADGETMSGFIARGLASRDSAHASGRYVKALTVLDKLSRRVKDTCMKAAIGR